ncbi:retrovirus-related pol polyprotein from transposon TNT 1-94 [Tanacetum coccineum]
MKIGNPIILDSYTNSMFLEAWGRNSYARILIEIDACNGFSDNLVMVVPNIEGPGYSKETIRVEYEWEPPRCNTCLIFGHSVVDCPKALKRVVIRVDKGKGGSFGADNESFVEVKKKKSGGNKEGTKNFKPVSIKQKTQYHHKVNQSTEGNNGKKNVSTSGNSSNMANMTDASTSGNGTFSLSNSFKVLNVDDPANVEVESSNKASTSSVQEEGQSATPLVEKINMFEKHILEGPCVLVDDASKLVKGWEAYGNAEYGYDPYVDDLYEGQEILTIFNLYAIISISRFEVERRNRLDIRLKMRQMRQWFFRVLIDWVFDRTLEAKVYRKWISKSIPDMRELAFCCILIDKDGDAIQANMDINNIEHFNPRLKLGAAYRISRFIWQEHQFSNHHFKFVSYNQLGSRVPYRGENSKMVYPVLAVQMYLYHNKMSWPLFNFTGIEVHDHQQLLDAQFAPEKLDRKHMWYSLDNFSFFFRLVIRSTTITVEKDLNTWTLHEPILDTQIHSLEQPQEFLNLLILIGELIVITQTSGIAFAYFIAILMDIRLQGKMKAWKHTGLERPDKVFLNSQPPFVL